MGILFSRESLRASNIEASRKVSIAPMMDRTDRHFRYFLRLISRHVLLYTEMVSSNALVYGDRQRFLQFHPDESPVAFQLGGSDPKQLAMCAKMVEDFGYQEINLNIGCPSGRVADGRFGACLFMEPMLVAQCLVAMKRAVRIPVTVKTRIGVNDHDSYEELAQFIAIISKAGCDTFIIHARKALLQKLTPKQNRNIPPLRYDVVYRLKEDFPNLSIVMNGGIRNQTHIQHHLQKVDGVMIGREAYQNPYILAQVDELIFNDDHPIPSRQAILRAYLPYVQEQLNIGVKLHQLSRHIMGLFYATEGARSWRRSLSAKKSGYNLSFARLKSSLEELPG